MELIRKAFITNCILMVVCAFCLAYDIATFQTCYELLHSGDLSGLAVIIILPLFFLASLATVIMGGIQISIAIRNLVKFRAWYTILMVVISSLILLAPVVLTFLVFLL